MVHSFQLKMRYESEMYTYLMVSSKIIVAALLTNLTGFV